MLVTHATSEGYMANKRCKASLDEAYLDRTIIYGADRIAEYVSRKQLTVVRWRRKEAFPMAKAPDGRWFTSTELIDRWILARMHAQDARDRKAAELKALEKPEDTHGTRI